MSSPPRTAAARVRVFYALWPERALAERLGEHATELQAAVGGRITQRASVHLTLAFLGDVDASRLDELLAPPAVVAANRFELELDRLGVWHHNGVGWLAPSQTPGPLADLQIRLSKWLESIGFALERRAFKPHVTLLRKCTGQVTTTTIESIRWPVSEYVLVQSLRGAAAMRYRTLGRFPLAGRAGPA